MNYYVQQKRTDYWDCGKTAIKCFHVPKGRSGDLLKALAKIDIEEFKTYLPSSVRTQKEGIIENLEVVDGHVIIGAGTNYAFFHKFDLDLGRFYEICEEMDLPVYVSIDTDLTLWA